jgi:adenine-specific DNA-methyltransferase
MTTDPGDLVLDPTCGSGTTAYVAEQWGRRWITIDTSRVAVAIARQRLMTARFENYLTRKPSGGMAENPGTGFIYETVPHITLKSIAQNTNLDPIFEKHEPILDSHLNKCNAALAKVSADLIKKLATKLLGKQKSEGKRSITDADERRWILKKKWEHWEVPFDTDPDWPAELRSAVSAYRAAWRAKMEEVNACIAANADQEELVDKPKTAGGVRVSGPFTVEGVMPAEASLADLEAQAEDGAVEATNTEAYLERMLRLLKLDGVTFKGNNVRKFRQIEPLWKSGQDLPWHAEGWWEEEDASQKARVGIFLGPQYGPVTALALEEVMPKAGRTYEELVVAGFSFDPEAVEIIGDQASHPRLRVHQAFIRPDVNPGMEGLLKDQPRSQLFTVFGQPEISISRNKGGEHTVKLGGVDVYDPLTGSIHSTAANKVAAWFLDTDYDGRCFCMTQAFFPDQDAWEKIARALKSSAEQYAFEALQGTVSIPFKTGPNKRAAVKVIDPRGNEVMVVRRLEE